MAFPIVYTPEALALGDKPKFVSATDGDTPTIQAPIRMLGMDAPELHYGGATETNPGKFDKAFETFLAKAGRKLDPGLRQYLSKRLKMKASTRHIKAGKAAFEHFDAQLKSRLARTSERTGRPISPRSLFVMVSKQVFDRYGRLLAYVAPSYTPVERKRMAPAKRPTFNLQMMEDGHAISLIIYPNIPKPQDLDLVRQAVRNARHYRRGFWNNRVPLLHAFEFRWIVDTLTGKRTGPDRYCGDITTGRLYAPQHYYRVPEENRLWFFDEHVGKAFEMGFRIEA